MSDLAEYNRFVWSPEDVVVTPPTQEQLAQREAAIERALAILGGDALTEQELARMASL